MKLNLKAATAVKSRSQTCENPEHHILLVDDEAPNLEGLQRQLAPLYKVTAVTSAKEALRLIEEGEEFSTIVSDQIMPEMNGVEFLSELQRLQHTAPRIMLTGYAALDSVVSAINEAAVFRYITKPVYHDKLTEAVRDAVCFFEMKRENIKLVSMVKQMIEKNAELNQMLKGKDEEPAENEYLARKQDIVFLSLNLIGLEAVIENASPVEIVDSLDRIYSNLHKVVNYTGGVIDKQNGDGLVAIYGLSGQKTTNAAVKAASALAAVFNEVTSKIGSPFDSLRASLGVASGQVISGMMGSLGRAELAIVGEAASLAMRMQEVGRVALLSKRLSTCVDDPGRFVAFCSADLVSGNSEFSKLTLPDDFWIRDFKDIRDIGFLTQ